jgi:hypothetical protein
MSSDIKNRSKGLALVIAGVLFGTFMFFHPPNNPTGALNPIWAPIHLMWFISYLLILFGLIGIRPVLASESVRMGKLAWILSFLGTALSLPIAAWDAFIVPYLAVHSPEMITQVEETSMELPVLTFRLIVYLTVAIFSLGFVLLGIAAIRSRIMPRTAGLMVLIGAPLFWLGAIIFSQGSTGNAVTICGAVLFGIGIGWFGFVQRTAQSEVI